MTTETGSKLADLVAQAREAALALPEEDSDLRPIAFERVLDHLLGNGNGQSGGTPHPTAPAAPAQERVDSSLATEQQRVDAVARYFQIEPEQVRKLFDLRGDEPALAMPSEKLPLTKAHATRDIALLIGGVRTAVGLPTGTAHIRAATETYDRLDSTNFMNTLSGMNEVALLGKPRSSNRLIRMKAIGAEAARPLAKRLVA